MSEDKEKNNQCQNPNEQKKRIPFGIEITTTNSCNCHCEYCFENKQKHYDKKKYEDDVIAFLDLLCNNKKFRENYSLNISFWGGEPTLNIEFVERIIDVTYKYDFVSYFMYSNGTLEKTYKRFIKNINDKKIKNKFDIQLSYDGLPIHVDKRGDNVKSIMNVAKMLDQNEIKFHFKATLTPDYICKLPEIWKSYYDLHEMFGKRVNYSPTIETTTNKDKLDMYFDDWKKSLIEIAKLELKFISKYKYSLFTWFNSSPGKCNRSYSFHIHTDGNIYVCHGCEYSCKSDKFILSTLNDLINDIDKFDSIPIKPQTKDFGKCGDCDAVYCAKCHISYVDVDNIEQDWNRCFSVNDGLCKYYKYFGLINYIVNHIIFNKMIEKYDTNSKVHCIL